jgi:hypothetical protein
MFCCSSCTYKTSRKFNIKKHIINVHKRDVNDDELIKYECTQNSTMITQILTRPTQILTEPTQTSTKKVKICVENTQISTKHKKSFCDLCQKEFKTLHGFRNHQKICKGVSNILECHHCHKVFTAYSAKSRHIKICKVKVGKELAQQALQTLQTQNITNNTQNNTQTNSNNTIHTQNILHIQNFRQPYQPRSKYDYRPEDVSGILDFGSENRSYITDEEKEKISLACNIKNMIDLVHFNELHPENHNIRVNDSKSYAVLKNKEWMVETVDYVRDNVYRNSLVEINKFRTNYILNTDISQHQKDLMTDETNQLYNEKLKKKINNHIDLKAKILTDNYYNKSKSIEPIQEILDSRDTYMITV